MNAVNKPTLLIDGHWEEAQGDEFASVNPADGSTVCIASNATEEQIGRSIAAAQHAWQDWSRLSFDERCRYIMRAHDTLKNHKDRLAELITLETGKTYWESHSEVASVLGKFAISIEAYKQRCAELTAPMPQGEMVTRHKPYGVASVLGPFNFPLHLPNGHIVPALLAGNTVVFKPSELTPAATHFYVQCWQESGIPSGVLSFLTGGPSVGSALVNDPRIRALLFTGSWETGKKLTEASLTFPKRILALEMGGNNPLVFHDATNLGKAAQTTILSAFLTSGQRCSCARRLIVLNNKHGRDFLDVLITTTKTLLVGKPIKNPEPFMGPVVSTHAAEGIFKAYQQLIDAGATPLIPLETIEAPSAFLKPGIVDVTNIKAPDREIFGPLLQVTRVNSFDEAIIEANRTEYGLLAGILTEDKALFDRFWHECEAGLINWNAPTTGASSKAPFGGIGKSGNYRPSAYYAADYCAYPVASIESSEIQAAKLPPGVYPDTPSGSP